MMKILLGHLGSNGDCLYATALARQIKFDHPGCHLTWAVSSLARRVLDNNPDIDAIWEIPLASWSDMERTWRTFESEAGRLAMERAFDKVVLTQISPSRFDTYDGTIRPSIFRNYPGPVTVPVDVTINLTEEEKNRVESWYQSTPARDASYVILFEASSKSGQSFVTPAFAVQVAERVLRERKKAVALISTHEPVVSDNPRIVGAGALSIRETTWLTRHVDLFVGCGSGLTVVATSGVARPKLPNIQILKRSTSVYASFRHDFEYFGKDTNWFLETTSEDVSEVARIVLATAAEGFDHAKELYHDPVTLDFGWYLYLIRANLVERGKYVGAARSLLITAERYGWHHELQRFARYSVAPFIAHDPVVQYPHHRERIEAFRSTIG